ncbi:hypothetical protein N781_08130 [Pontibacillus halophilus JSM 076056 = DSM 19796]|uniref:Uncharacterized protein n=1 Tax=Pontibacillus halophilus JSM 076056 = DSM 19796 TaxID=1385510 RepID=A0A0A5GG56_9BACI|nr:DUF4176 domain-containing protein [Pontibacillus halophilus]KGX90208.1 hypothetical protein N781_08130 [Pontibacillus halophilus JSM 076056 = DSM 19796]
MNDILLPNGSIVLLHGGEKKMIIYGRKQLHIAEEEKFQKILKQV